MFLLDENISFKVAKQIAEVYSNVIHVSSVGLINSSDFQIWEYARNYDLSIVTFDKDFLNISLLKGNPPKIILLKTGNRSTKQIAKLLIDHEEIIIEFINSISYKSVACLEVK